MNPSYAEILEAIDQDEKKRQLRRWSSKASKAKKAREAGKDVSKDKLDFLAHWESLTKDEKHELAAREVYSKQVQAESQDSGPEPPAFQGSEPGPPEEPDSKPQEGEVVEPDSQPPSPWGGDGSGYKKPDKSWRAKYGDDGSSASREQTCVVLGSEWHGWLMKMARQAAELDAERMATGFITLETLAEMAPVFVLATDDLLPEGWTLRPTLYAATITTGVLWKTHSIAAEADKKDGDKT